MLSVPLARRRILVTPWIAGNPSWVRRSSTNGRDGSIVRRVKQDSEAIGKSRVDRGDGKADKAEESRKPSLIEQLFPEETKRYEEAQRKASREIPRLPLDNPVASTGRRHRGQDDDPTPFPDMPYSDKSLAWHMHRQDEVSREISVLVLRNASPNLTEEDFRRLIPQGKHMEGWTLEQGDIIKVVAGRDLATLEHANYYYLLFSSKLSAFTYQGQATRIFRMASSHTPSSMTSALPPPPGYMIDGMDAHAAIEAFALIPASQNLELRQLQPPLSPMMQSIVRHQGYASLVNRKDKMPHEVRLTFDGPQLQTNTIRHILHASGRDRALAWSGGEEVIPKVTKWEPQANVSPLDHNSQRARKVASANERTEEEQMQRDFDKLQGMTGGKVSAAVRNGGQLRRTPQSVYIVGFHTENAARSFIAFWHRRPMTWQGVDSGKDEEEDLPPVANVEMLW